MVSKSVGLSVGSVEEALNYLDAFRRKRLILAVLFIVLASFFGAGGFALLVTGMIMAEPPFIRPLFIPLGGVFFLVILPTFVLLSIKMGRDYRARFLTAFVPSFGREAYEDFSYSFKSGGRDFSKFLSEARRLTLKSPDADEASFYEGSYRGVKFASFAYDCLGFRLSEGGALSKIASPRRKSASSYGQNDLGGRYFSFEFDKASTAAIYLRDRRSFSSIRREKGKWVRFESESTRFNETFEVYFQGEDELAAQSKLSPRLIAGLLSLNEEFAGYLHVLLVGKKALCLYDHYDSGVRLSLLRKATPTTLACLKEGTILPRRLIVALGLASK